jgi:hypothetical protein
MWIRWTVEAHGAAQEREIAIGFGKGISVYFGNNEPYHELRILNYEP